MYALDIKTQDRRKRLLWKAELGGGIFRTLATEGKSVFVPNLDGTIYALACEDGSESWRFDTGFGISAGVLLADGKVIAANREGRLVSLDKETGKLLWDHDLGAPCLMTAASNEGRVYIGAEDMKMRALDAESGKLVWTGPQLYGDSFHPYFPVVHADQLFVRTKPGGETMAYSKGASADGYTGCPPAFHAVDGKLVMHERNQKAQIERYRQNPWIQRLYALDEGTGKQTRILFHMMSTPSLGFGTVTPPAVDRDGMLIVGITYAAPGEGWASTKFGRMDPHTGFVTKRCWPTYRRQGRKTGWCVKYATVLPDGGLSEPEFLHGEFTGDEDNHYSIGGTVLFGRHAHGGLDRINLVTRQTFGNLNTGNSAYSGVAISGRYLVGRPFLAVSTASGTRQAGRNARLAPLPRSALRLT